MNIYLLNGSKYFELDFTECNLFEIKQQENGCVVISRYTKVILDIYAFTKSYFLAFQRYNLKLNIISVHNKDYFYGQIG